MSLFPHLPATDPLHIMDVGALEQEYSVSYDNALNSGKIRLTGFEPGEDGFAALQEKADDNRTFYPWFIGDGKTHTFYETVHPATGSLFEPDISALAPFGVVASGTAVKARHTVETKRLDDLDLAPVDFLKIDVQGAEVMIFENAHRTLQDVLVIQTEVCFLPMYKNQPLFHKVDPCLRDQGFEFMKFLGFGGYPFDTPMDRLPPQLMWADAIYYRPNLETYSDMQLLKLAIIMDDFYGCRDVSALALRLYDQRTGSNLSEQYLPEAA